MEMRYRPEIDGLRAIAVLSIIIYHAEIRFNHSTIFEGGFLGVDVFFVISGYLITSIILKQISKYQSFSYVRFYERRVRRLIPALLVVIVTTLPFAWMFLLPSQLMDFSKSIIASILFGSNFYWYESLQEYGAESALIKPFLHTWSLAVEEQYYLIFPIIITTLHKWNKNFVLTILIVGFILSIFLFKWTYEIDKSFSFYMLPSRFWELIAGVILAYISQNNNIILRDDFYCKVMPGIGLLFIVYSILFGSFDSSSPSINTLTPVIGTMLIIWYSSKDRLITKILSNKILVGIGLISYSLYLWHYPIFAFGRIIQSEPTLSSKFVWIILTFSISIISYLFIENPFRQKNIISNSTLLSSVVMSLFIVGCFTTYTLLNDGIKERFKKRMEIYGKNEFDNNILKQNSWQLLDEFIASSNKKDKGALFLSESTELWFSNNSKTKNVLIIGDSHGKDLFNAFYQNRNLFKTMEFARFGMQNIDEKQMSRLLKAPNFLESDIIILSYRYNNKLIENIPLIIDKLIFKNKVVFLSLNTVEFYSINGQPIFDNYIGNNTHFSKLELNKTFFKNRKLHKEATNKQLIEIASSKNIKYLNKSRYICNSEFKTCDGITLEGYKSFYDYGHYTLEGAQHFGRRIYEINWLDLEN